LPCAALHNTCGTNVRIYATIWGSYCQKGASTSTVTPCRLLRHRASERNPKPCEGVVMASGKNKDTVFIHTFAYWCQDTLFLWQRVGHVWRYSVSRTASHDGGLQAEKSLVCHHILHTSDVRIGATKGVLAHTGSGAELCTTIGVTNQSATTSKQLPGAQSSVQAWYKTA
jgi:hypothetical protein